MDIFDNCGELLNYIGRSRCTRSSLEHIKRGFFKDRLDAYIDCGLVEVVRASDPRNDKFFLTEKGLNVYTRKITIEDAIRGTK